MFEDPKPPAGNPDILDWIASASPYLQAGGGALIGGSGLINILGENALRRKGARALVPYRAKVALDKLGELSGVGGPDWITENLTRPGIGNFLDVTFTPEQLDTLKKAGVNIGNFPDRPDYPGERPAQFKPYMQHEPTLLPANQMVREILQQGNYSGREGFPGLVDTATHYRGLAQNGNTVEGLVDLLNSLNANSRAWLGINKTRTQNTANRALRDMFAANAGAIDTARRPPVDRTAEDYTAEQERRAKAIFDDPLDPENEAPDSRFRQWRTRRKLNKAAKPTRAVVEMPDTPLSGYGVSRTAGLIEEAVNPTFLTKLLRLGSSRAARNTGNAASILGGLLISQTPAIANYLVPKLRAAGEPTTDNKPAATPNATGFIEDKQAAVEIQMAWERYRKGLVEGDETSGKILGKRFSDFQKSIINNPRYSDRAKGFMINRISQSPWE